MNYLPTFSQRTFFKYEKIPHLNSKLDYRQKIGLLLERALDTQAAAENCADIITFHCLLFPNNQKVIILWRIPWHKRLQRL